MRLFYKVGHSQLNKSHQGYTMALHPTLEDFLHNFLKEELDRLINKAAKLELSLYFHQALMKEVCFSIKS